MNYQSLQNLAETRDAALSYFVNQLDAYDPKLHLPLTGVTWSRDVPLRSGLSFGNETTSFVQTMLGAPGTLENGNGGFSFVSDESNIIPGISIDGLRKVFPLRLAAREVSYTQIELERSQKLGQSIDQQKVDALNLKYQMEIDQMIYRGYAKVGATGLLNDPSVTVIAAPNGAGGSPLWSLKTPAEILNDVNLMIDTSYAATGYTMAPRKIGLPPAALAALSSVLISAAGNSSILKFVKDNSFANEVNGSQLEFVPMKWAATAGVGGVGRAIGYTQDQERVRYPLVPIQRWTPYYQGMRYSAPYAWMMGQLEFVYPETAVYLDGIV